MAPSTWPPTIHIRRLKGHSVGLIAKPVRSTLPMLPKVAHGGLNFSWWYDKISYAPVPSAVRPFHRQANSDFRWPIVGGIIVPSINRLWNPVWRLSACLETGTIYNILFNMQNPSKILLKLKLGNSKVLQITS